MPEIIAEIGKNFVVTEEPENETMLFIRARNLIISAYNVGARVVKFQVHNVDDEIHPLASSMKSPHFNQSRYDWVKRNTYSEEFWFKIKDLCRELDVEFLATPMSRGAAEILDHIGIDRWKIGSGDILDFVMLDYIRDSGKPVILSTGMSALHEIDKSFKFLKEKTDDVSLLHCVSNYPCKIEDLNLNVILYLKKEFGCKVGFSDHTLGIEASLMAVAMGAEIIEKHFTMDRKSFGPDHKVSLQPLEFDKLIGRILNNDLVKPTEEAMGSAAKGYNKQEQDFREVFRKGLYVSEEMKEGRILAIRDIISLRPVLGTSVGSENYPEFVGKVLKNDRIKDGALNYEIIK